MLCQLMGDPLCQYLQIVPPELVRHSREYSSNLLSGGQRPGCQHSGSSIGAGVEERGMSTVTESPCFFMIPWVSDPINWV